MANTAQQTITTPVGRMVAGDLFTPRTTDQQGNPLTIKTGPNAGQPTQKYFIGLAIPKTDAGYAAVASLMAQVAQTGFPHLFQNGQCTRPDFAWKIVDGDSGKPNRNNSIPNQKEGYPGHWVINMESSIAPKIYDRNNAPISAESKAIKRGDFVRVYISIAPNNNAQNPGLFVNPVMVQFSHQGEEIFSGPDAASVFGAAPAAPAGAVTTPQPSLNPMPTGTVTPQPGAPGAPNGAAGSVPPAVPGATSANAGAGTPQPGTGVAVNAGQNPNPGAIGAALPQSTPVAQVQPAPDFLNPQPGAQVAPPVENFVVNGVAYTRDQLRGWQWTDAQIDALPRA